MLLFLLNKNSETACVSLGGDLDERLRNAVFIIVTENQAFTFRKNRCGVSWHYFDIVINIYKLFQS